MGIFNSNYFSATATESYDLPVVEGAQYDVDNGGAANIAMESYDDMLEVVKAIHKADILELTEASETVMESAIGDIFRKIIDGIKAFFAKVATFFKNLYEKYVVMKKSNKSFADKFKELINGELGDHVKKVTFQGYDYDVLEDGGDKKSMTIVKISEDLNKNIDDMCSEMKTLIGKIVDEKVSQHQSDIDAYKNPNSGVQKALDKSYTPAQFSNASHWRETIKKAEDAVYAVSGIDLKDVSAEDMYKMFRKDATQKTSITWDKAELLKQLETLAELDMKEAKKAESSISKSMDKIIKVVKDCENEYKKGEGPAKSMSVFIAQTSQKSCVNAKSKVLTMCSVYRSCISDYANQIKTATVKAVAEARAAKKDADKSKK